MSLINPFPTPTPLPELVAVSCAECQEGCEACNGTMTREVCGGCLEVPTVIAGNEACACTFLTTTLATCEICERTVSVAELDNANVCIFCRDEMAAKIQQEEDERSAWIAEQLELGRSWGWL